MRSKASAPHMLKKHCHPERTREGSGHYSGVRSFASTLRMTALLLFCGIGGCQAMKPGKPLTPELAGNDPGQQLEFWHSLTTEPVTTNDQAFHGLLLFIDGKDDATDYAGRVYTLKQRQMLPSGFDQPATAPVTRGTLSVGIVRV